MRPRLCTGVAAATALLALAAPPAGARTVNDPALSRQWGLAKIGAPAAWDVATGAGTTIAVVDSGVDLQHEDLAAKLLPGRDFSGAGTVQDDCGHGTHVSGIAAAITGNGRGVAGVAPDARILPVKALRYDSASGGCSGSTDDVAAGIRWAADQGATVINLSLGSEIQFLVGSGIEDDITYAWNKGAVVVVAAGNQYILGSGYTDQPAIIVTATTRNDGKPSYSSTTGGARWAMSAPGGAGTGGDDDVLSTYWFRGKTNSYAVAAGTSMATPHVAGAAAVLRSAGLTPQQTVDRLLATATDLGAKGPDSSFGAGRLDLAKATSGLAPSGGAPATAPKPAAGGGSATTAGPTATNRRGGGSGGGSGSGSSGGTTARPPAAAGAPITPGTAPGDVIAAPTEVADPTTQAAPPQVVLEDAAGADAPSGSDTPRYLAAAAATAALSAAAVGAALAVRRRRS